MGLREWIFKIFTDLGVSETNTAFNVLADVLSMLAIPLLIGLIKLACDFIASMRSGFTGKWEQLIYDPSTPYEGKPTKKDIYYMKHYRFKHSDKLRKNVKGRIVGKEPDDRKKRKWDFYGYLDGNVLTIIFQSDTGQKSRGCIYLKYVRFNEKDVFKGYYLEEHDNPGNSIDKTPLILRKIERKKR